MTTLPSVNARIYIAPVDDAPSLTSEPFCVVPSGEVRQGGASSIFLQADSLGVVGFLFRLWQGSVERGEYIGLMQGRRYLSLSPQKWHDGVIAGFDRATCQRYGWDKRTLFAQLRRYDVIVPYENDISDLVRKTGVNSVEEFYLSEGGTIEEIRIVRSFLQEQDPALYHTFCEVIQGRRLRPWLLFVLKEGIFDRFCARLFPALSTVIDQYGNDERPSFQRNRWELLTEIIFNAYIRLTQKQRVAVIDEQAILFLDTHNYNFARTVLLERIVSQDIDHTYIAPQPVKHGGKINIVISFDSNYIRMACTLINSVLSHTGNQDDIVFYIIHDASLTAKSIAQLETLYRKKVRLVFLRVGKSFVHKFPLNRSHITVSTYYRLLIHNLVPQDITRVIYLDADMIVCKNIVDLWNMELNGSVLGGVRDETDLVAVWNLFNLRDIACDRDVYINAGVLIFDVARARELYGDLDALYINSFQTYQQKICSQDQDILNISYRGKIQLLPQAWNVGASSYYCQSGHSEGRLDGQEHSFTEEERNKALLEPAIVHFTGRQKPWRKGAMHPLKRLYWHYYRKTPGQRYGLRERFVAWNHFLTVRVRGIYLRQDKCWRVLPFRRAG